MPGVGQSLLWEAEDWSVEESGLRSLRCTSVEGHREAVMRGMLLVNACGLSTTIPSRHPFHPLPPWCVLLGDRLCGLPV